MLVVLKSCLKLIAIHFNWSTWLWSIVQWEISPLSSNFKILTLYTRWSINFEKGRKRTSTFRYLRELIFSIYNFNTFSQPYIYYFLQNCLPLHCYDFWMTGRIIINQEVSVWLFLKKKRKLINSSLIVWDRAYKSSFIHSIIQQIFK